jgi:hypothetical protein
MRVKSLSIPVLVSILAAGCTHTIKPDADVQSYHERIEKLSAKRDARIIILNASDESGKTEYTATAIRINADSLHFYCPSMMRKYAFPNQKVEKIVFTSGSDGGVEGMLAGVLAGTAAAFAAAQSRVNGIVKQYPHDPDLSPGDYYLYLPISIPIGMLLGYVVGASVGQYEFLMNQ